MSSELTVPLECSSSLRRRDSSSAILSRESVLSDVSGFRLSVGFGVSPESPDSVLSALPLSLARMSLISFKDLLISSFAPVLLPLSVFSSPSSVLRRSASSLRPEVISPSASLPSDELSLSAMSLSTSSGLSPLVARATAALMSSIGLAVAAGVARPATIGASAAVAARYDIERFVIESNLTEKCMDVYA